MRDVVFLWPFRCSVFTDRGELGERGVVVSLLSVAALIVCMPADRESECAGHFSLLVIRHLVFTDWVGSEKGLPVALIPSCGILSVHVSGWGRRVGGTFCFAPSVVQWFLSGGWGGGGWRFSTLGGSVVGMHARG